MELDKGPFIIFENKTAATNLQLFAVPWLIAAYGLLYAKSMQMSVLKKMLIAMIDENNLLGQGLSCSEQPEAKLFPFAFADLAKNVKIAAGIYFALVCFTVISS